jgi:uncharacterized protein
MRARNVTLLLVITGLAAACRNPAPPAGAADSTRGKSDRPAAAAFEPQPASAPVYGVRAPAENPELQKHYVVADDGLRLYVETWLPVQLPGGPAVPEKIPTVLLYSPYERENSKGPYVDKVVSRGYAMALGHVRGYGSSEGCPDFQQPAEREDGALIVQYLGRAPWSNGNVGMIGLSYDAATQLFTATAPSRRQYPYLKALVPIAPLGSVYDTFHYDGVPGFQMAASFEALYTAFSLALVYGPESAPPVTADPAGRLPCRVGVHLNTLDSSGDWKSPWAERDVRPHLSKLEAPVLMTMGHRDGRHISKAMDGLFDRLDRKLPRAGLFGVWRHGKDTGVPPDCTFDPVKDGPACLARARTDVWDMIFAWFDHWLKGIDTGVAQWPVAQVQDTTGQWRTVDTWPHPAGEPGQLALSAGGELGATEPTGSSSYLEAGLELRDGLYPPGTSVVFETPVLNEPLELIGRPVLHVWVVTDQPDGHIAARIEALGPDGTPVINEARTEGARSLRHLDPLEEGVFFQQAAGKPAPVGEPIEVLVRLNPHALVVPAGGRLRLTIAGSADGWDGINFVRQFSGAPLPDALGGPTELSGAFPTITVLHDCEHPSLLRFTTRDRPAAWLDVREAAETGVLTGATVGPDAATGGGIALARVCGKRP